MVKGVMTNNLKKNTTFLCANIHIKSLNVQRIKHARLKLNRELFYLIKKMFKNRMWKEITFAINRMS